MLRLFVPAAAAADTAIRIAGVELRHLRTLRLGPGDRLRVFDEHGTEHEVVLAAIGAREAVATIVATARPARESGLDLVLAPALLKGPKMDLVVEKATELGVRRIAPVVTRYTIGRSAPVERWRRIALSATKQSGGTQVPRIDVPLAFAERLREPWAGLRLLAWEAEEHRTLGDLPATAEAVVVVLGPEGGFAAEEVEAARRAGFTSVGLSRRVLRAETAAIVGGALCQARWGNAGPRRL